MKQESQQMFTFQSRHLAGREIVGADIIQPAAPIGDCLALMNRVDLPQHLPWACFFFGAFKFYKMVAPCFSLLFLIRYRLNKEADSL